MFRRIFITLLILSIALPGYSDSRRRFYSINNFSKGLNSHISPYLIDKERVGQAYEAKNIRFNDFYGTISKRSIMLQGYDFGSSAINSLHRFYQSDGTAQLLATYNDELGLGDDAAGTGTTLKDSLSTGKKWTFVTFKDLAIGMDGTDRPVKYDGKTDTTANTDGARTADNLVADLGAPFAELNTGANLDASKWYQYKILFNDGATITYSNGRSNAIQTGSSVQDILLTGIPLGPTGTTSREVFRTLDQANKAAVEAVADTGFYRITTINDNTTTSYADTNSDASISGNPTFATRISGGVEATPPIGAYCCISDARLWIAGNSDNPSRLYFSDNLGGGNPDYFTLSDALEIRPDDGDKITFIKNFLGQLIVAKTNSIQKIFKAAVDYTSASSDPGYSISDPYSFIGCPAPYSVAVCPNGLLYLGRKGLYLFNGNFSQSVSDAVTNEIDDINQAKIEEVEGVYFNNEYQLTYMSTETGAVINDRILIYDFIRDSYTMDLKNINAFAPFNSGDDQGILYLGSSDADGVVWANEGSVPVLSIRYKSEFDAGTFDDARVRNTEEDPIIALAWDIDIDSAVGTINAQTGIIDRPDTDGSWTSEVYEVNASTFSYLLWNEILGATGEITWQIRTDDSATTILTLPWGSEYTDPTGADISSETGATYIQLKANFSTDDIEFTPNLFLEDGYVFKIIYSKTGSSQETSVLSIWKSGWTDLGLEGYKKQLDRIKIYYRGTLGTLNFEYDNDLHNIEENTFSIDLSVRPSTDIEDEYYGDDEFKIFEFIPPTNQDPIGQFFQFTLLEDSQNSFVIDKIEIAYTFEESTSL